MPVRASLTRAISRVLPLSVCGALLAASAAAAQQPSAAGTPISAAALGGPVDSSYLGVVQWRSIGPSRGGRVLAVSGDPSNRLVAYLGAAGGGVWKTEDGGHHWRNLSDGWFHTGSVGAIAVAPSNPSIIYVGMGEACIRGDVSHGDGVYRSADGGRTWTHLGLDSTLHIARVRVDPRNPDVVFVAALGDAFGPNPERGVYKSTDGGQSWRRVLYRDENTGAIDLSMDPGHPDVLYASLLQERRYPWGLRSAGPGTGLFKSTDGGEHWTELTKNPGMPEGILGRIGVALSPADPNRVYAIIDAKTGEKGLFRSDDGGATWQRVSDDAELTQRPWYYHHIFADPKNPDLVYVLNVRSWMSRDGGKTWSELRPPHGDSHDLWIDPADPAHMVEGNDGGAAVTYDGGESWSSEMNQPTAQLYHVTTDDQFPYRVYGPQQDEGSISLPSRSDFREITSQEWETVGGGESGYIAVDQTNPNSIFAAEHHWLEHYDRRTHQRRDISPWPETWYGWGARDIRYRFNWTYPVVLSHDNSTLYATSQVVHASTNQGQSWTVISPDLTRHDTTYLEKTPTYGHEEVGPYWGPITRDNTGIEWYSVIFAFAESPLRKGLLWAGSDDGLIHLSRDGGKSWSDVTPKELPPLSLVSIIDPSPFDPGTMYFAATRYKLQDRTPYLFRTTDYGRSWTKITTGIPAWDFTRVIRADPERRGTLYAGTETGIYISFDDGAHWQSLRLGLPVVPVHDLEVKDGDLIAATHGRGFWILDDASPLLRQLTPEAMREAVHLFTPDTTVRFRSSGSLPAGGEDDDAAGRNPPNGVVLEYYLAQKPAGDVTLTVSDAAGKPIRSFTSGGRGRERLTTNIGVNRFVWDMRYPGPNVLPDIVIQGRAAGPLAVPGRYRATLVAGGGSHTTPFVIVKDPRVRATQADLAEQFRFITSVNAELTRVHDGVRRIRSLRARADSQASRAAATPDSARVAARVRALNDRLYAIEEGLTQFRARAPQDLSNFPTSVDSKLASLAEFAGQADARPTAQDYLLLTDLTARASRALSALAELARTEFPTGGTPTP